MGVEVAVLNARAVVDEERENKARRNPWIGNKMRPKRPVKCTGRLYVLGFVQNSGFRKMVEPLNWLKFIHPFFRYSKITTIFFSVLDLTLILITKMPNIQSSGNISVETILSRLFFFLFDVLAFLAHESPHKI